MGAKSKKITDLKFSDVGEYLEVFNKNLLYLTIFTFLLVSTLALTLNSKTKPLEVSASTNVFQEKVAVDKEYPSLPILNSDSSPPILSAQSVLAVDLDSGATLYEKSADTKVLPASTTKIITALVAMDYYSVNDVLVVKDPHVAGQKMGLVVGEEISARDLLYGLLVFSANDAAEVLANNYPGGRGAFIKDMNKKAKNLGLKNSVFKNPTGLDGNEHYTTARDLINASVYAMEKPLFRKMVGTKELTVKALNADFKHKLVNINELLGTVEGVLGVKTGWTESARENLVSFVERDNKKIIIALLGSQDRFGESEELIEWIFENYKWVKVDPDLYTIY